MTPEEYARAKELFTTVSQLASDEREAFLARQADLPPAILAEVRSLLEHHNRQTLLLRNGDTQPYLPDPSRPLSSRTRDSLASGGFPFQLGPQGYLALGIVLACLLLGIVNYLTRLATQSALRELRASTLRSGLDVTVEAIELWIDQERTKVEAAARDPELRRHTQELVTLASADPSPAALAASPSQAAVRRQIEADFAPSAKYAIWDRRYLTIADWSPDGTGIGGGVSSYGAALLARVFAGETVLQMPGDHPTITQDYPLAPLTPTIGIIAPIRDSNNQVAAALLIYGIGAERRFNEILALVQFGETGETYAFDRTGLMLSESRFQPQLTSAGLIDPQPSSDRQRVYVRDPGGDLTQGYRPSSPPETWPPTTMARFAVAGKDDVNLDGYRDYRGVTVVGAWKWLPQYDFGVATELDVTELNAAFRYVRWQSAFKFGLLAVALAGAVLSYYSLARLRRSVGTNSQVGQYTLEEKIGEGGMGVVYKARHALLKRPTAVKLLKADVANARTVGWFQREVQLASQLTHPNTIAIYDYGITPEGLFYYVMEYLDGINLLQLVEQTGPLPAERAIHILRQIGGSLREAHHVGLVHRDIKPHNIMLCQRACEVDVVKVLDFGLVKEVRGEDSRASTVLAGTPIYMAPERISAPGQSDPRVDLYALGAVGFYLLTGHEIFSDADSRGVLFHVMNTVPPPVTQVVNEAIPQALADLIADCLAKNPADRPPDIDAVLGVLDDLQGVAP